METAEQIFSFVCGQSRSFIADGAALPVCQRCLGLYLGAALTALWLLGTGIWRRGLPSWSVFLLNLDRACGDPVARGRRRASLVSVTTGCARRASVARHGQGPGLGLSRSPGGPCGPVPHPAATRLELLDGDRLPGCRRISSNRAYGGSCGGVLRIADVALP
jgi:hypothetical protein